MNSMFVDSELNLTIDEKLRDLIQEIPFEINPKGLEGDVTTGYRPIDDNRPHKNSCSPERDLSRSLSFIGQKDHSGNQNLMSQGEKILSEDFSLKGEQSLH